MKKGAKFVLTSIVTAIGASLCCITPILALISGTSGFASTFSWLEPLRPYLIGLSFFILVLAWYQKLKPKKEMECDCEINIKPSVSRQSKLFLGIVTAFALLMISFPYYSSIFYPTQKKEITIVNKENFQSINFSIKGMTCSSCEQHINHAVNQVNGVLKVESSYKNEATKIEFDKSKTNLKEIEQAINSTGYTVIKKEKK